jgi:hypothetical protein
MMGHRGAHEEEPKMLDTPNPVRVGASPIWARLVLPLFGLTAILAARGPPTDKPGAYRWVALDGHGRLYVTSGADSRVDVFTTRGKYLSSFGSRGAEPNQFQTLEGIGVDALGNIYVADAAGIKKFDRNGGFLTFIGGDESGEEGLSVDADGTVYVSRLGKYTASPSSGPLTDPGACGRWEHRADP